MSHRLLIVRETPDLPVLAYRPKGLHFARVSLWDRLLDAWHSWRASR